MGALFGLIQQIHKLDRAAIAGLERFAVGAVHGAKAHMFKLHGFRHKAGQAGNLEYLLKVQGLALVNKVQHAVGVQLFMAVTHGGQIAGGVQIATAGFLNDHR